MITTPDPPAPLLPPPPFPPPPPEPVFGNPAFPFLEAGVPPLPPPPVPPAALVFISFVAPAPPPAYVVVVPDIL